ncbi:hypothetical protein T492DRAFT_1052576 [Pavlovales sp. CCMP2436]|nr:hypothetical protein T492DRAFT_1052576 [Pavlovales sp. CCMP2436]
MNSCLFMCELFLCVRVCACSLLKHRVGGERVRLWMLRSGNSLREEEKRAHFLLEEAEVGEGKRRRELTFCWKKRDWVKLSAGRSGSG